MHVVYGTWNAPWVKHLTQECAAETFASKVFETFNKVSWIIWKKIIAFLTQFFAAAKESQGKFRLVRDSNPWPPGCQRLFLARFLSGSWLRPTAEDVSAFGQHRKFPPRARKTSGTQGTAVQWLQRCHVGKKNMLQNVGRTTFCAYLFAFSLASLSLSGCLRMVSFRGQIKFESHPDWCPLGIHFNFLMSISTLLTKTTPLSSPLVTYTSPKR